LQPNVIIFKKEICEEEEAGRVILQAELKSKNIINGIIGIIYILI
jgi:hypothetical protein